MNSLNGLPAAQNTSDSRPIIFESVIEGSGLESIKSFSGKRGVWKSRVAANPLVFVTEIISARDYAMLDAAKSESGA